jgi:hypothetical protein
MTGRRHIQEDSYVEENITSHDVQELLIHDVFRKEL